MKTTRRSFFKLSGLAIVGTLIPTSLLDSRFLALIAPAVGWVVLLCDGKPVARLAMHPDDPMLNPSFVGRQEYVFKCSSPVDVWEFDLVDAKGHSLRPEKHRTAHFIAPIRMTPGDTLHVTYERTL